MSMTTHRPYLIRALNEWILDNKCTPYLLVNALDAGVEVPRNYVKDGQIILNISPVAVNGLRITNESLEFSGRFGGVPMEVYVPVPAVLGIYARENGQGMIFETDDPIPEPPGSRSKPRQVTSSGSNGPSSVSRKTGKPNLKVVK